jgi:hypothetical protein
MTSAFMHFESENLPYDGVKRSSKSVRRLTSSSYAWLTPVWVEGDV